MNFYKRSYQPILRYLYPEAIKCRGEISLHKQFKYTHDGSEILILIWNHNPYNLDLLRFSLHEYMNMCPPSPNYRASYRPAARCVHVVFARVHLVHLFAEI